ncbi:AAA family ATPase [Bacillus alveayuensis]|uniref:AAA family ATPase n=1 Tax=Aeribacillus alveayuensis TaxID=279215 RepID=UPI0005D0F980|nr:MoxR family ATPase [Bacillus alveayuensis]
MVDETMHPTIKQLLDNIENVIIGKREAALLSLVALLAEGHVLLEDVPGVGKTKLVKTLAKLVGLEFKRIQFTPDLLPSDVTGVSVYNPKTLQFEFRPGPIMGNIILADEVNRTSPKTQSALLEGMEEGNVTIDGKTMSLPKPFFVLATQNPIEYEGTYPLPEAQLDRFLLKMKLGYPSYEEEIEVLSKAEQEQSFEETEAVITKEELIRLQKESQNVYVDEAIKKYIISLVQKTREHPSIYLGVSPRGSIALMKAAKAYAFIQARDFVIPDDVQYLAPYILSHRMILISEAKFAGKSCEEIVQEIINDTPVPIERNLFS